MNVSKYVWEYYETLKNILQPLTLILACYL